MTIPDEQIEELKGTFKGVMAGTEGGTPYFLIPAIALPPHCSPSQLDGLLCPLEQSGYPTRMYFSHRVERPAHVDPTKQLAWQPQTIRVFERNWQVLSWRIANGTSLRLLQMVRAHLEPFQ